MKHLSALCSLLFTLLFALSSLTCAQRVRVGAETLIGQHLSMLRESRIGLICNHTSVLPDGTHLVDTLLKCGVYISALFSPEHGIRGSSAAGEKIYDSVDVNTGLQIYSLYNKTRKPTAAMLRNVDIVVFDLQDVGARYYTYASTMAYAMQAAAENGKKFIVLDRPNPINGVSIEGPVLDTTLRSFVGMFPVPVRHGVTLGELAKMIVGERWVEHVADLDLTVIPMEGWKREMWYDETGLPWVPPSPNIKTLATATVYPGTCLFEGTNVSEGRGTDRPFEYIGAPWINGDSLVLKLNNSKSVGVQFTTIRFVPNAVLTSDPKYVAQQCRGVFLDVTDRSKFSPFKTAFDILESIKELYPDSLVFKASGFDRLVGQHGIRQLIESHPVNNSSNLPEQNNEIKLFERLRIKYLLY